MIMNLARFNPYVLDRSDESYFTNVLRHPFPENLMCHNFTVSAQKSAGIKVDVDGVSETQAAVEK